MPHQVWREANSRLIPSAVFVVLGLLLSTVGGNVRHGSFDRRFLAFIGIVLFVVAAIASLNVVTKAVHRLISTHRLAAGRAGATKLLLRAVGYGTILVITLDLLGVPVGRLLLGGAALGIILGVAAQQALANFFASVVIIVSHPFMVGQEITLRSGALGGEYVGTILDIGLTHTRIKIKDGTVVSLPNAAVLSGAAILVPTMAKSEPKPHER